MVTNEELIAHYEKIRPHVEGDGSAMKGLIKSWCPAYLQDAQETAEALMLEFNMDVADRYFYGLCSCVTSTFIENGRTLPVLSDSRYAELSLNNLVARRQRFQFAIEHNEKLILDFSNRMPITTQLMEVLGRDLVTRLNITQNEVDNGFNPGVRHAMSIIAEAMRK